MRKNKLKSTFKIMDVGNFFFPLKYAGEEFEVEDTYTIDIDMKSLASLHTIVFAGKYNVIDFNYYAREIWDAIEPFIKGLDYKTHWIAVNRIESGYQKNQMSVTFDILKSTKSKEGKHDKKT